MNKIIIIIFAVFAVINRVQCTESGDIISKVKFVVNRLINKEIDNYLGEGLGNQKRYWPEAIQKFFVEYYNTIIFTVFSLAAASFEECQDKADDSLSNCAVIQTYTINCTRPVLKDIDDRLPAAARGLFSLGVKSFVSIADFLCKQTGENILELVNPCLCLWNNSNESSKEDECEQKIKDFAKKCEDSIPTQTEICNIATIIRNCIQTKVQSSCKNQKTRDVIVGIIDATIAPCGQIKEV